MSLPRNVILVGDVRRRLREIPTASIDCVITSPPYFQLREYGVVGQLGLEDNVAVWVDEMRLVMRGLARVLKATGSLWLNLGDSYSRHARFGAPRKSLMLAPERLLLELASDGWIVRNKVIWAKTNPMPHSVADRLTNAYDVVYFLSRSPQYFFDLDAIRVPHRSSRAPTSERRRSPTVYPPPSAIPASWSARATDSNRALGEMKRRGRVGHLLGKNPGDVWPIATASFHGAHFATFPLKLVERPLLATCPERVCGICDAPYRRVSHARRDAGGQADPTLAQQRVLRYSSRYEVVRRRGELRPTCECNAGSRPGLVLDPFMGSGTVALAAIEHKRDWLGIELNPSYAAIARRRIAGAETQRARADTDRAA